MNGKPVLPVPDSLIVCLAGALMRLKLLSCDVFYREMCYAAALAPHQVDCEFLPKGLHDLGCQGMRPRLQAALDRAAGENYDAILLGYALCNNGVIGLVARSAPLVVPRGHDCITLFLGSARRYEEYFNSHPGVYFKTSGWIERGQAGDELHQLSIQHKNGLDCSYGELVAKYGEDNAKYLFEMLGNTSRHYGQFTFIEMGLEPDGRFEQQTQEQAAQRGWKFEKLEGNLGLIRRLLSGEWAPEEFLVVPPGEQIIPKYDGSLMAAGPAQVPGKVPEVEVRPSHD